MDAEEAIELQIRTITRVVTEMRRSDSPSRKQPWPQPKKISLVGPRGYKKKPRRHYLTEHPPKGCDPSRKFQFSRFATYPPGFQQTVATRDASASCWKDFSNASWSAGLGSRSRQVPGLHLVLPAGVNLDSLRARLGIGNIF